MSGERIDVDPLDTPLSRRDLLDVLHELGHRKGEPVTHGQIIVNAIEQRFRVRWSERPKPEKLESEAHDAD